MILRIGLRQRGKMYDLILGSGRHEPQRVVFARVGLTLAIGFDWIYVASDIV